MVGSGPETSGRSAQELLEEFEKTGLQGPFEEVVRRYSGMVYQVCYSITRNAHDAEDATQAVFLTLAAQRKIARNIKYVGPWLQQVAYRTSLDMRRSHKRRVAREERAGQIARQDGKLEQPPPELGTDEMRGVLRDELDKLPAKYRLPLILHYFGGLSPADISKEIGCKPKTLGVRLFRGRKMLRENLSGRGVFLSAPALAPAMAELIRGGVADGFVHATSHAATRLAASSLNVPASLGLTSNIVSNQVLSLVRSAGRAMMVTKLKWSVAIALFGATAVSGASQFIHTSVPVEIRAAPAIPPIWDALRSLIDGIGRVAPRLISHAGSLARADAQTSSPPAPTLPEDAPPNWARRDAPSFSVVTSPDIRPDMLPETGDFSLAPMMVWTDATGSSFEIAPLPPTVRRTVEQNRTIVDWSATRNTFAHAPEAFSHSPPAGQTAQVIEVQTRSGLSPTAVAEQSNVGSRPRGRDRASSSSESTGGDASEMWSLVAVGASNASLPLADAASRSAGTFSSDVLLSASDAGPYVDPTGGVFIVSNTPEPSAGLFLSIGAASLLLRRRRHVTRTVTSII